MIQTHPPLAQRLAANASMLATTPKAPAEDSRPKSLLRVSDTCGEHGVAGMYASKTQHATAAQNAN